MNTDFSQKATKRTEKSCPCGCGKVLKAYNGKLPLVCPQVWKLCTGADRSILMLPGSTIGERRGAERRLFELAKMVKRNREGGK